MAGGGLLALIAYGSQNVILSGNPQMTYFYKAFKRYTHFAMENITIPLEGPNELFFDQTISLRAKIPRNGDLLSELYFSFRVPDIYSKYMRKRTQNAPPNTEPTSQWEFQWVRYLGAALIRNVAFYIGPNKIQEFDGSYMLSKALLDMDQDTFAKWKKIVGDSPELTDPANSAYVGGTSRLGYPSVITDPARANATQANRPSIFGREVHVPLSFWFSESTSQALPLVGLQYQDCEVQMTLNPISQLYTILDASGFRVSPEFIMKASSSEFNNNNPFYGASSDISGQSRFFYTDIGFSPPPLNSWNLNPRLQGTFVYLPKQEQAIFASRPLTYIYRQVTAYPFQGLYNRQILDIQTHNPINRLIFVMRRSDSRQRNDFANFTNWYTYPFAPFSPTTGLSPTNLTEQGTSGRLIPNAQLDIIRNVRIICDGNEIQEPKPGSWFSEVVPYKYVKGIGQDGLPLYTFELISSATQPAGSINASRIRNFQIDLDVYPLPTGTNYTYDLTIYVENLNWLEVVSGSGAQKFAL
jgi:hypothetical protein